MMFALSSFRLPCVCHVHQLELKHSGLQYHNPLEYTLGRHMCHLVMVCGPHRECTKWLLLLLAQVGGA